MRGCAVFSSSLLFSSSLSLLSRSIFHLIFSLVSFRSSSYSTYARTISLSQHECMYCHSNKPLYFSFLFFSLPFLGLDVTRGGFQDTSYLFRDGVQI